MPVTPAVPFVTLEVVPASTPRTPERQITPEMDVEVGGTPEPETTAQDMALDGESDAIVQQLEKGLPRWEGFEDAGWSNDIPEVCFLSLLNGFYPFMPWAGAVFVHC